MTPNKKGQHWFAYINGSFFDSYGFYPPRKLSSFNIKRNRHCLFSDYRIRGLTSKTDSFYAGYCLYVIYLRKSWE